METRFDGHRCGSAIAEDELGIMLEEVDVEARGSHRAVIIARSCVGASPAVNLDCELRPDFLHKAVTEM